MALEKASPRAKAEVSGTLDEVKLVRTAVLCNGELATYGKTNKSHIPTKSSLNALPADLDVVADHLYALNDLQLTRDTGIDPSSLCFALKSVYLSLPEEVRRNISIPPTTSTVTLFGVDMENSFEDLVATTYKKPDSQTTSTGRRQFWRKIRKREHLFWPILTDRDCWSTVVMHMQKSSDASEYDTVAEFAVVDASRHSAGAARVRNAVIRLKQLFEHGDISFKSDAEREIWVPPQDEANNWESGLRSFQLIRQLLQRVTDGFCRGVSFDSGQFFGTPTSSWINVDFVRHEMIGMVQQRCNDALNYACRYALEPIQEISIIDKGTLPPDCLGPLKDCAISKLYDMATADAYEDLTNEKGSDERNIPCSEVKTEQGSKSFERDLTPDTNAEEERGDRQRESDALASHKRSLENLAEVDACTKRVKVNDEAV